MELLIGRRLTTGLAIAAGSLGVSACGTTNYHQENSKQSKAPVLTYNRLSIEIPGSGSVTFSCQGANLVEDTSFDTTEVYLNDPACKDDVFSANDLQAMH